MARKCPACKAQPCAEGRARCLDCLEGMMRSLTAVNRNIASREKSTQGTQVMTELSPVQTTPVDHMAVNWIGDKVPEDWASIPDAKCKAAPKKKKGQNKGKDTLRRNQYLRLTPDPAPPVEYRKAAI